MFSLHTIKISYNPQQVNAFFLFAPAEDHIFHVFIAEMISDPKS